MKTKHSTKAARTSLFKRDTLILDHLQLQARIARSIARRLPPFVAVEDMEQEGMLALIAAADSFDSIIGVCFADYATRRIVGAIRRWLLDDSALPRLVIERRAKVERLREELFQSLHRPPTHAELIQALRQREDHPQLSERIIKDGAERVEFFSSSADTKNPQAADLESLSQRREPSPFESVMVAELHEAMIKCLDPADGLLVSCHLLQNMGLREVAAATGLSDSTLSLRLSGGAKYRGVIASLRNDPRLKDFARHLGRRTARAKPIPQNSVGIRKAIHPAADSKELYRRYRQGRRRTEAEGRKNGQTAQPPAQDGPASIPIPQTPTPERSPERMAS